MKTTYIETNNLASLKSALGRLIDYALYLTENDPERRDYIYNILNDEDICYDMED